VVTQRTVTCTSNRSSSSLGCAQTRSPTAGCQPCSHTCAARHQPERTPAIARPTASARTHRRSRSPRSAAPQPRGHGAAA
jgi:hypothetical protein